MATKRRAKTTKTTEASAGELRRIVVANLIPTPDNPRHMDLKGEAFQELLASVRANGVLVPVHARPHPTLAGKFDLRAGARRWYAAKEAKLDTIPCIVRDLTDAEAFEITFTENYAREDLTPMEEGRAVEILLERFGGDVRAVGAKLGRSPRWVATRCKLADLAPCWRNAAEEKTLLTIGHLELIARLPLSVQEAIHEEVVENLGWNGWTVEGLEAWIDRELLHRLVAAPWDLGEVGAFDEQLGAFPACIGCPTRSSQEAFLFHDPEETAADVAKSDCCLDVGCWDAKMRRHIRVTHERIRTDSAGAALAVSTRGYIASDEKAALGVSVALSHSYSEKKGPGPGIVPAVLVDGPRAGHTTWVKPDEAGRGAGARGREKGKPTTLAERREKLEAKRWFDAIHRLHALVEKLPFEKLPLQHPVDLCRLAAAFGTEKHAAWGSWHWSGSRWRLPHDCMGGLTEATAPEALWEAVRPVLADRIRLRRGPTQTETDDILEARRVADLCGIEIEPLYAAARDAHKEPKSWAKLAAQEAEAAAKKKPAKARKARKGKVG